jgi:DNA (cytosine-5)-methyltransferase 1
MSPLLQEGARVRRALMVQSGSTGLDPRVTSLQAMTTATKSKGAEHARNVVGMRAAPCAKETRVASLFSGIGGIELGLHRAGFAPEGLGLACEIDRGARAILSARFGLSDELRSDVRDLRSFNDADLVTAGFPCQDLSQAGLTVGIDGDKSGLVSEVFRLLAASKRRGKAPRWVLFENVPFMLRLQSGRAMERVVQGFEELGYRWWAYRVLDAIRFGLPQRRRRVFFLASRNADDDPRSVLFDPTSANCNAPRTATAEDADGTAFGFYWTEGNRGLGWASEALPTLKGGSGLGIPSPPAIWLRDTDEFVTPSIELAERVQGFPAGWTDVKCDGARKNARWSYVGNAVPVAVAEWVGTRLLSPVSVTEDGAPFDRHARQSWPNAAFGIEGGVFGAEDQGEGPVTGGSRKLLSEMAILAPEKRHRHVQPLSLRAATGVLFRLTRARVEGRLRPREDFMDALARYVSSHPDQSRMAARLTVRR